MQKTSEFIKETENNRKKSSKIKSIKIFITWIIIALGLSYLIPDAYFLETTIMSFMSCFVIFIILDHSHQDYILELKNYAYRDFYEHIIDLELYKNNRDYFILINEIAEKEKEIAEKEKWIIEHNKGEKNADDK